MKSVKVCDFPTNFSTVNIFGKKPFYFFSLLKILFFTFQICNASSKIVQCKKKYHVDVLMIGMLIFL